MAGAEAARNDPVEQLLAWVVGHRVGSVTVRAASSTLDDDFLGRPLLVIELTLSDPPEGSETWPVEDIIRLESEIGDRARFLHVPIRWHVTLEPETPEPLWDEADSDEAP